MPMQKKIIIFLFSMLMNYTVAQDRAVLIADLKGKWSFSIGFDERWISRSFDDSKWEIIKVPDNWEDHGFHGYNGYACYRKEFSVSSEYKGRNMFLNLGYIDDVDEVYLNGRKIGSSGGFPPKYSTAYNAKRIYYISEEDIIFDRTNLVVVKVYDSGGAGGIVSGNIGLYGEKSTVRMELSLQKIWKFRTGDDPEYKNPAYDDSNWDEIFVPAKWENQGHRNYDGYAWYRNSFIYRGKTDNMFLILGRIDDIDQVFVNDKFIGSTGDFNSVKGKNPKIDDEYDNFRAYVVPDGLLKRNRVNVIAVRVFDKGLSGGIYEGPVGLMTKEQYFEYRRRQKRNRD